MLSHQKVFPIYREKGFSFLNFIQETASIGTWEVDLSLMKLTWSNVTKQIHEVDINFEPKIETAILFYKEGYSRDTITKLFTNCIEKLESYDVELQIITANGKEKWVRAIGMAEAKNGIAIKVHGGFQDIDEKTKAFEACALSEEQFRKTFEFAGIGMGLISLEGKWIKVNKNLCTMLGYAEKELLYFSCKKITHKDDASVDKKIFQKLILGELESYQVQKRYIHKNNSIVWANLSISLVKNDLGEPIHFVAQINDITTIKTAKNSIKSLLEISEKQNKKLLNFAHIVSHNIRSHYSNLDMLLNIIEMDEPQATKNDIFPLLKSAVKQLRETVENLNDVVLPDKESETNLESVNLSIAIKKTIASNNASILKNNIEIKLDIPNELNVIVFPAYLDSILLNLFSNAIKYKSPNRRLKIHISTELENGFVVIKFKDNGIGIDLDLHSEKIFGMYKTFHTHENSKGLGLFIVKNQVEALGGCISIESKVNSGSTFIIHLKHETN